MHKKELQNFSIDIYGVSFKGILEGVDITNWDDKLIEILLKNDIFVKCKNSYSDEFQNNNESLEFEEIIYYKNIKYELNPIIIVELFFELQEYTHCKDPYLEDEIEELFFKVNSLVGQKDKIRYLKKQFKKQFPEDLDFGCYSNVINDGDELFGLNICWYEHIYDFLVTDSDYAILKLYLITNKDSFNSVFDVYVQELLFRHDNDLTNELGDLIDKWKLFNVHEIYLNDILWKINDIKKPNNHDGKGANEDFDKLKLSALEAAYYVYYMKDANERIFENRELTVEVFFKKIGEMFGCNGKNIQLENGKLLNDKDYRLKLTKQRVVKLNKILPILTEKAKNQCKIDINSIEQSL